MNTDAPEQRIDSAIQCSDHWPDPSSLNEPLPCARFPDAPCPAHQLVVFVRALHHHPAHSHRPEHDRTNARGHVDKRLIALGLGRWYAPTWRWSVRHSTALCGQGRAGLGRMKSASCAWLRVENPPIQKPAALPNYNPYPYALAEGSGREHICSR